MSTSCPMAAIASSPSRSARAWSPRPGAARCCWTRASSTSPAWPGRAAARSKRVDVSVDGGRNRQPRAWRTPVLSVPDALQHRLGLGRQARHPEPRDGRHRLRAADATRHGPCVARARSIQQLHPVLTWCGKAAGGRMSGSPDVASHPAQAASCCCGASAGQGAADRFPGVGRAATPKEVAAWDIDVRPACRFAGRGSVAEGQVVWEAVASPAMVCSARIHQVHAAGRRHHTADDIRTGRVAR